MTFVAQVLGGKVSSVTRSLPTLLAATLLGCGAHGRVAHPDHALRQYTEAIESSPEEAYDLLSQEQRARMSRQEFVETAQEHPEEVEAQARQLGLQLAEPIPVWAEIRLADGEVVTLVLEEGEWRIADGPAGAISLASPLQTVRALRRSLRRRSYAAVLRVLSREARSQLEDEITRIIDGLEDEEDLRIEVTGNRARVIYDENHFIELVREDGAWVVVDMN